MGYRRAASHAAETRFGGALHPAAAEAIIQATNLARDTRRRADVRNS